eukprot:jgi/Chlat1/3298/Chrsp22S03448
MAAARGGLPPTKRIVGTEGSRTSGMASISGAGAAVDFVDRRAPRGAPPPFITTACVLEGGNGVLEAFPPSLHFFAGASQKQTASVRIVNTSATTQRFSVAPPQTPEFTITLPNKKPQLAPGMSQDVLVTFSPPSSSCSSSSSSSSFDDALRVRSDAGEPFAVRLRARCDLRVKEVKLGLTDPTFLPAEGLPFALTFTDPDVHEFSITPFTGLISRDNPTVTIAIAFDPVYQATYVQRLRVRVGEKSSVTCTLTGSASPPVKGGMGSEKSKRESESGSGKVSGRQKQEVVEVKTVREKMTPAPSRKRTPTPVAKVTTTRVPTPQMTGITPIQRFKHAVREVMRRLKSGEGIGSVEETRAVSRTGSRAETPQQPQDQARTATPSTCDASIPIDDATSGPHASAGDDEATTTTIQQEESMFRALLREVEQEEAIAIKPSRPPTAMTLPPVPPPLAPLPVPTTTSNESNIKPFPGPMTGEEDPMFAPRLPEPGLDWDHLLPPMRIDPTILSHVSNTTSDPAMLDSMSVRALSGSKTISDSFVARRDSWRLIGSDIDEHGCDIHEWDTLESAREEDNMEGSDEGLLGDIPDVDTIEKMFHIPERRRVVGGFRERGGHVGEGDIDLMPGSKEDRQVNEEKMQRRVACINNSRRDIDKVNEYIRDPRMRIPHNVEEINST